MCFAPFLQYIEVLSPITNTPIASIRKATLDDYERCSAGSLHAWQQWVDVPAPRRGEIVRQIGDRVRAKRDLLGKLVGMYIVYIFRSVLAACSNL